MDQADVYTEVSSAESYGLGSRKFWVGVALSVTGMNRYVLLDLCGVKRLVAFSRGLSVSDIFSGPHKNTVKSFSSGRAL